MSGTAYTRPDIPVAPTAAPAGSETWTAGAVIDGRYEVLGVLGRGGMGVVHRVRHLAWGTDLAVKSPLPAVLGNRPAWRERLTAEAQTWVSLGLHPHVCGCHYVRTLGGIPRIFTEYVPGNNLAQRITDRTLYAGGAEAVLARVLDLAVQVAWGLEHAHARGVVHQDVKPANVLLDDDGTAKITDFGLAVARTRTLPTAPATAARDGGAGGMTLPYASPEQAAGGRVGRRSDLYSFAVSVLEMFTGGVRWMTGPAAGAALDAYLAEGPDEEGLPALPPTLARVLTRCLRHDPADRPSSMTAVAAELTALHGRLLGRPYPRPEPRPADLKAAEHNNHALSLLDLGDPDGAAESFRAALAADPQHLAATYNAGLLRWRRGEVTDVALVTELESARVADGDTWQARLLLAQVHLERGDLTAAARLLERVRREAPREPEVLAAVRALDSGDITDACYIEKEPVLKPSALWGGEKPCARLATAAPVALTGDRALGAVLFDLHSEEYQRLSPERRGRVRAVDITPDGRLGASAAEDAAIRVWDLASGRCTHVFDAPYGTGTGWDFWSRCAVRLGPDGRQLLWARDGIVVLWDLVEGTRRVLTDKADGAAIAFSPDGSRAVLARPGGVADHDLARRQMHLIGMPEKDYSTVLGLSRDGTLAAIGTTRGPIRLVDLTSGVVRTLAGHKYGVSAVSFDADARYLMSGATDRTVRLWDLATGRCLRTFTDPDEPQRMGWGWAPLPQVTDVLIAGDARTGISMGEDGRAYHWRMPAGHTAPPSFSRPRPQTEIARLATEVDALVDSAEHALRAGRHLAALVLLAAVRATPGHEREPRVLAAWRRLADAVPRTGLRAAWPAKPLDCGPVFSGDISYDGRIAVTGGYYGELKVWDAGTGDLLRELRLPERHRPAPEKKTHPVLGVCLSRDGRRLLSASDGAIRLWSTETGACLRAILGDDTMARTVRFTGDDSLALVGRGDNSVQLWDLETAALRWSVAEEREEEPEKVRGSGAFATRVWAAPGGRLAATSAGGDGYVRLTELATGHCLRRFKAHLFRVQSLCLSPDERWLLTAGGVGEAVIRLWNVATGERVRQFTYDSGKHMHRPTLIRFTADGRFAVTSGEDETLVVWDVGTGWTVRVLEAHAGGVGGLAPTGNAHRLLSWGWDATTRLWELDWELENRERSSDRNHLPGDPHGSAP
ncbi:protein kinase domain-containing protein [Streptomyces sp. NPDC004752]